MITLGPGQFIYGRKSLARKLDLKESTAGRRMKRLERMGTIAIQPDPHFSIVTIVNWDIYQGKNSESEHPIGHPKDTQRTGKGQAKNTYKNGEKGKKGENVENGKTDEASRDDHKCNKGVWGEVKEETLRLAATVNKTVHVKPDNRTGDRSVIVKACYLVVSGVMPEAWLHDAVEAVKKGKNKENTAAYFHSSLAEGAKKLDKDFCRLLATDCNEIPADVLIGKPVNDPSHQNCIFCVPESLHDS